MRLIAIGKLRPGPEQALFDRYNTRLRPKLTVTELPDGHGAPAEIKRREGDSLLAAIPADSLSIALDMDAPPLSSEQLALRLQSWLDSARAVSFIIGGAEGLAQPVLDRANHTLTLGPLTWPHMLVRVMLAEQLYRAQAISAGHPYHRGGRPI